MKAAAVACGVLCLLYGTALYAESGSERVVVRVREVKASGSGGEQQFDERIGDLKKKLRKLQYKNFRLAAMEERSVPLMQRETIELADGQVLTVRPLYVESSDRPTRVGMWLNWKDSKGMQYLDTRMHFSCSDSFVTGAEGEGDQDEATILAIKVTPP